MKLIVTGDPKPLRDVARYAINHDGDLNVSLEAVRVVDLVLDLPTLQDPADGSEGLFIACSCPKPHSGPEVSAHAMTCPCRFAARILGGDVEG
jgi:hypothetical protein